MFSFILILYRYTPALVLSMGWHSFTRSRTTLTKNVHSLLYTLLAAFYSLLHSENYPTQFSMRLSSTFF